MKALKISDMSGKLTGIPAINTSPKDNPFCQAMHAGGCEVCTHCYSHAMLDGHRRNCRPAWARNGEILSKGPLGKLPAFKPGETVRFSGHGELHNAQHMSNLFAICRHNPDVQFTLWTKRIRLVQSVIRKEGKLDNLILIRSSHNLNKRDSLPKYFDKVFTVWSYDHKSICCGKRKCKDCMICYGGSNRTYVDELLK